VLPQVDAGTPATFSSRILQGLLRDELGFNGVIVTDALDMKGASGEIGIPEAAVRALSAGCDLLCLGTETSDELLSEIIRAVSDAIDAGRLSAERVADAAGRVGTLARRLEALRASIPERPASSGDAAVSVDRAAQAFDVRADALDALRRADEPFAVVRLETEANIAVGVAPWGPFAQVVAEPASADSVEWAGHPEFIVSESDAGRGELDRRIAEVLTAVPADRGVVVIGKAVHRHPFARATVDALRSARTTLVVDMGWPSDDRAYADVATFGASRPIGRALISLLAAPADQENHQ
jgi:beta-N-acetylhexosaminidase